MKIILIHGAYGNQNNVWFPWLVTELQKLKYEVIAPAFPTPQDHNLESWMSVFKPYLKTIDENTMIIGHSIGCAFALHVLEQCNKKIKAIFLIAGFSEKIGIEKFDKINQSFLEKFDFEKIKRNCKHFFVYGSDNDPYVTPYLVVNLATKVETKMILIKNAGHFQEKTFEKLLEDIKRV